MSSTDRYAYIPAAWRREVLTDFPDMALYTEPRFGGMVTVDYHNRGFRVGLMRQGRMDSTKKYSGRGWRQRLELDAVAHLQVAVNK